MLGDIHSHTHTHTHTPPPHTGKGKPQMKQKVKELEDKLRLMKDRYEKQHSHVHIEDITCIVSCAALVFGSGSQKRADAVRAALALVADEVRGRPLLKPLRDAGRLLVIVLSANGRDCLFLCDVADALAFGSLLYIYLQLFCTLQPFLHCFADAPQIASFRAIQMGMSGIQDDLAVIEEGVTTLLER